MRRKSRTGKIMELLIVLSPGDFFYTDRPAKDVKAYASTWGVKCKTEIVIVIEDAIREQPKASKITKVTIL